MTNTLPATYVFGNPAGFFSSSITKSSISNDTLQAFDLQLGGGVQVPTAPGANLLEFDFSVSADASGLFGIYAVQSPLSVWSDSQAINRNQPFVNVGGGSGQVLIGQLLVASVAAPADLSVSVSDLPDPVLAGDSLLYSVTVDNAGPDAAEG